MMRLDHEDVKEVLGTMDASSCSRRPAWSRGGLIVSASAAAAQQTSIPLIHPSPMTLRRPHPRPCVRSHLWPQALNLTVEYFV